MSEPDGADLEARVRGYVGAVIPSASVTGVARFASGVRHHVFRVSYTVDARPGDVVVRIALADDEAERTQAAREALVLRHVDGMGAPRLLDLRVRSEWFDAPVLCLSFVDGRTDEVAESSADDLEQLGALVGRLHQLPTGGLAAALAGATDAAEYRRRRVEQVRAYLPSVSDPLPPDVQARARDAVAAIERAPTSQREPVLLHGDVARSNVVWAAEPVLIDWEYARLGDAADEVAYAFTQNGLDGDQRAAFWSGYERHAPEPVASSIAEDLAWWEPVTIVGSALWWIDRWARRAEAGDGGDGQHADLDEALRLLDRLEPRLPSAGPSPTDPEVPR